MPGSRHQARMAAVQALYQWALTGQDTDDIESHFIYDHDLSGADKAYFHHLVKEVPLRIHELEDHIIPHIGRDIENVDPVERAILRIAAFELEFEHDIPFKVVINEAVELAKTFASEQSYRFINGVMDKVAMELRSDEMGG